LSLFRLLIFARSANFRLVDFAAICDTESSPNPSLPNPYTEKGFFPSTMPLIFAQPLMELNQIIKILPPIVLGIGGILPVIIVSSQSVFAEAPKTLLCIIMILVVWIGYLGALMSWQRLLFDDRITLAFLVVALVCLIWVLLGSFPSKDIPDASGQERSRMRRAWKSLVKMAIPTPNRAPTTYFAAYSIALLAVSVTAALYVAPKDRVVIRIELPVKVSVVELIRQNADPLRVWHKRERGGVKIVLSHDEFGAAKSFIIHTVDDTIWTAEQSAARPTINPALGERYTIRAYASNEIR
jgi:hypothetical protein